MNWTGRPGLPLLLATVLLLTACLPAVSAAEMTPAGLLTEQAGGPTATPLPERPLYDPGELVAYRAQTGDTLPSLAARFNTTIAEIRTANPQIPLDASTMPPGMPMQIPIYYLPLWGTPFQILPDNLFVNGPSAQAFNTESFVATHSGWLKDYSTYAAGANRSGAQVVDVVALNYSIDPRLLLAILEYQTGALSRPDAPDTIYALGFREYSRSGIYLQLTWAANLLNNGYYGWRTGLQTSFERPNGSLERPDPWQNAASVGVQYYYSRLYSGVEYDTAVGPQGLARTYHTLFGDPWTVNAPHIPVSLQQPDLRFPFRAGESWAYTGGPHTGWGQGEPYAAIDFAPPNVVGGCAPTDRLAVAVADGVVARSEIGIVVLDLDGDGDERTGWVIFYLHLANVGRAPLGAVLRAGDPVGYPSCERGTSTGTHIHIARRFNGEWIPADGAIPFNLEGWVAHNGNAAYSGTLTRGEQTVIACQCADAASQVRSER
ncbi:MAG: LysM peptidoglycan-binding domain-containing protein [Anaerolineales bacterium]|nr:LysM peptidoglycan-binding domain-containing protein [Anaerolineales bacterium]